MTIVYDLVVQVTIADTSHYKLLCTFVYETSYTLFVFLDQTVSNHSSVLAKLPKENAFKAEGPQWWSYHCRGWQA